MAFAIVMSITLTLLCLSYAQPGVREGGGGKTAGGNPRADSGEGEERKGDDVCSLLEIHEIEKVGDLPKKRINTNI